MGGYSTLIAKVPAAQTAVGTVLPGGTLSQMALSRIREADPKCYADIVRIVNLEVVDGFPDAEREDFRARYTDATAAQAGFRLRDVQVDAVLAWLKYKHLFAPIGVGHGKTAVTIMVAAHAFRLGYERSVLFVPPQVLGQLWQTDIPWLRRRVATFGMPCHLVSGSVERRKAIVASKRAGLYVFPWSLTSAKDAEFLLASIAPKLVIGDECHYLRTPRAARTKRVLGYVARNKPSVAWLSGTVTARSLMDYWHLVAPMGDLCPMPLEYPRAKEWAGVLDADAEPGSHNVGSIRPLVEWAIRTPGSPDTPFNATGFRRAYRYRMKTSPAVVATGDESIGVSLTLQAIPADDEQAGLADIDALCDSVVQDFLTPSGDEIDHAIHMFKWLYELSGGFYNELYWPTPKAVAKSNGVSEKDAEASLKLAKELHALRQEYHRQLRAWLHSRHRPGLDTPFLVGRSFAAKRNGEVNDQPLYEVWSAVKDFEAEHPKLPERASRGIRIADYKVRIAERWAAENPAGIIWCYHQTLAKWVAERLPQAIYCPSGSDDEILKSEGKLVIASVSAHGTGKNLQFHQNMLYLQVPRSATLMEQSLGRIHRFGQKADELTVQYALRKSAKGAAPTFDELVWAAMLNDACYVQTTTGAPQRAMYCVYDPLPKVVPSHVLEERGLDPKLLSADAQRSLAERFTTVDNL